MLRRLRKLWKVLICKHNRTVKIFPDDVSWENTRSGARGKHNTVVVGGCLDCGVVWVRDYGE